MIDPTKDNRGEERRGRPTVRDEGKWREAPTYLF